MSPSRPGPVTLDRKTGKKVGISTFLRQSGLITKPAMVANLIRVKNGCVQAENLDPGASKQSEAPAWLSPILRPHA